MKSHWGILAVALLAGSPAVAMRIWFSPTGVAENEPIHGTPSEYIDPSHGFNPVFDARPGTTRLYVWGTLGPDEIAVAYRGISLDVTIYPRRGNTTLSNSHFYNFESPLGDDRRWHYVNQGNLQAHKLDELYLSAGSLDSWGLSYQARFFQDVQFDKDTFSMLLGFVDLAMTPDAQADIFCGIGDRGFIRSPPTGDPTVFFGWDDEALHNYDIGFESRLPDAKIVPEPASVLLLLAVLPLARRRGAW